MKNKLSKLPTSLLTCSKKTNLTDLQTKKSFPMNTEAVDRLLGSACYSCDSIRKEFGYFPARDFLSAIGEMVQWYRKPSQGAG